MELSHILVLVKLFLINVPNVMSKIQEYSDPQMSLWTLSVRHCTISISENGTLSSSPTMPTLYSIFRSELYSDEQKLSLQPEFSLVGIASGYRICMDKYGNAYTKKVSKKEKKWNKIQRKLQTKSTSAPLIIKEQTDDDDYDVNGTDNTSSRNQALNTNQESVYAYPQVPPDECLFKSYSFDQRNPYNHKTAIYSIIPFNSTRKTANFLAFLKNGDSRRFRLPLDNVRMHGSISIQFEPLRKQSMSSMNTRSSSSNTKNKNFNNANPNKKVEKMLSQTIFEKCDGRRGPKMFNLIVRDCVKSSTKSLNINRLNHTNLSKIIQKCLCPMGKICRKNKCVHFKNKNIQINSRNSRNRNRMRRSKNLTMTMSSLHAFNSTLKISLDKHN